MKRTILLLACVFAIATTAEARMMYITHHPCLDGGGGSYSAGYIDDRTGRSYVVTRDCWGNICVYPLYGPFQPRISGQNEWELPENYDDMVRNAHKVTEPGADVGIRVIDRPDGDTLRFRNPAGAAEQEQYLRMWMENENGGPNLSIQQEFNTLMEKELAQQTTEERMKGELIDRYWNARFGENGWPAPDEMQMVTSASALIVRNGSNIAIIQTPAPANGQTLIIAPLLPELSSPAAIYSADGQRVWSGELDASTTVQLGHLTSGMYIIRALGRDVPISLVR